MVEQENVSATGSPVPSPDRRGFRWPSWARVLVQPRAVFTSLLGRGDAFWVLFGLLIFEQAVSRPLSVATHAMRIPGSPFAGLTGLLSSLAQGALFSMLVVFAVGAAVSYGLRFFAKQRLDVFSAASLVAYAYVPHTLVVAASVLLAGVGVEGVLSPHQPLRVAQGDNLLVLAKWFLAHTPTLIYAGIAFVVARRSTPTDDRAAELPRLGRWAQVALMGALLLVGSAVVEGGRVIATDWTRVRPLLVGDPAPSFVLRNLDGGELSSAEVEGSVVLIDFWATWCAPCVASMPYLQKLHHELGPAGFRLVSVNVEADAADLVGRFRKEHGLTFPIYVDDGHLQRRLRVDSYPTAFLIDRQGVVHAVHIGAVSMVTLRNQVEGLLAPPR